MPQGAVRGEDHGRGLPVHWAPSQRSHCPGSLGRWAGPSGSAGMVPALRMPGRRAGHSPRPSQVGFWMTKPTEGSRGAPDTTSVAVDAIALRHQVQCPDFNHLDSGHAGEGPWV